MARQHSWRPTCRSVNFAFEKEDSIQSTKPEILKLEIGMFPVTSFTSITAYSGDVNRVFRRSE